MFKLTELEKKRLLEVISTIPDKEVVYITSFPSGIASVIKITSSSGKTWDITDYDTW